MNRKRLLSSDRRSGCATTRTRTRHARRARSAFLGAALLCLAGVAGVGADTLTIAQVDNTRLLLNQTIRAYVSVVDGGGNTVDGLGVDNFRVFESSEFWPEAERDVLSVEQGVNMVAGITVMLVLDNSGSMYWDASGAVQNSADPDVWRITAAKRAIRDLLGDMNNPSDQVGLVSFNLKLGAEVAPTSQKVDVEAALEQIVQPAPDEAFTELYESLYHAVDVMNDAAGRRVIILLSDGTDSGIKEGEYDFFPVRHGIDGAVAYAQETGVSVFTIGLSRDAAAESLQQIASATGGRHFSVEDPDDLSGLYRSIRAQILAEYVVTYAAGTEPAEYTNLRMEYVNGAARDEGSRPYYSSPLFGLPAEQINWLAFLAIIPAILLLWLLSRLKFEKEAAPASLQVLGVGGRRRRAGPMTIADKGAVTIGGGSDADLTLTGDTKVTQMVEARIEQREGVFTVVAGDSPVTVNNRPIKTRALKSGDVITVGETTIVFDGGATTKV